MKSLRLIQLLYCAALPWIWKERQPASLFISMLSLEKRAKRRRLWHRSYFGVLWTLASPKPRDGPNESCFILLITASGLCRGVSATVISDQRKCTPLAGLARRRDKMGSKYEHVSSFSPMHLSSFKAYAGSLLILFPSNKIKYLVHLFFLAYALMIPFTMAFFVGCKSLASFCSCSSVSSIALACSTQSHQFNVFCQIFDHAR